MGNKPLSLNYKRKSRNFKPELKNSKKSSKLNVLPEPRSKNNAPNFPENSKNSPKDLKKLVVQLLLKLNSTNAVKLKWPNLDAILKNLTWPMSRLSPLFVKSKLTKSVNFLN